MGMVMVVVMVMVMVMVGTMVTVMVMALVMVVAMVGTMVTVVLALMLPQPLRLLLPPRRTSIAMRVWTILLEPCMHLHHIPLSLYVCMYVIYVFSKKSDHVYTQ